MCQSEGQVKSRFLLKDFYSGINCDARLVANCYQMFLPVIFLTKDVTFTNAAGDTLPGIAASGLCGLRNLGLTVSGTITNNGGTSSIHLLKTGRI